MRRCLLPLLMAVSATAMADGQGPAPDALSLRIIVVESADDARRIETRLAAGDDFGALARALSVDASAVDGGLLGSIRLSTLRPEVRAALRGVGVGQVAPVVRIPLGLALLQVVPDAAAPSASLAPPALAAEGSVKYLIDVGGFAAAVTAARVFASPGTWHQSRTACDLRAKAIARSIDALRRDFGAATPSQPGDPEKAIQGIFIGGQLFAYEGRMNESIREFERAYDIARHQPGALVDELEEPLGIAYLHRAEMANGLYREPGDRCLLSERGLTALTQTADLDRAMAHFKRHLAAKPDDLEGRWLLNLAAMMAGRHPRAVPAAQLIPASVFGSAEDVGRFRDVAGAAGLQAFAAAGGLVVDDFDGDGRLDVVTSTMDPCGSMRLFHAEGDGRFTDRTAAAGLGDELGSLNILHADYDNDGDVDLLALRGGWEVAQRKSLLRNDGRGIFTNVTVASGLAATVTSTQTAVWADYDNDGLLDLFVGNEESAAQLFRNKGDGSFADVSRAAGVGRSSFAKGVAAGDYDGDGWADLYVSNLGGGNFLYRNDRDGRFVETAQAAGVTGPGRSFATWFFDYDNDGWQDLFMASYFTSLDETARTYLKLPHNAGTLKLYRNLGNGRFEDATAATGLEKVFMPMGANFGDLDNDGFLDIYLGTGNPSYASLVPSVLLRNRAGRAFVDVTSSSGTGELHKGHGVAFADLDDDGDEEMLFEVGGATLGDRHAMRLFENPGHGNAWIDLALAGTRSNRSAIGARITITLRQGDGTARRGAPRGDDRRLVRRFAAAAARRVGTGCARRGR